MLLGFCTTRCTFSLLQQKKYILHNSSFYCRYLSYLQNVRILSKSTGLLGNGFPGKTMATEVSRKKELQFRTKDDLSADYELIYAAPMVYYIHAYYCAGIVAAIVVPLGLGYVYLSDSYTFPIVVGKKILIGGHLESLGFTACFAFSLTAMCSIVFRYPLRIYHNPKKQIYTAVMPSIIPFVTKNFEFNSSNSLKRKPSGMMEYIPWNNSLYVIGNKPVILIDYYFRNPKDISSMIGGKWDA